MQLGSKTKYLFQAARFMKTALDVERPHIQVATQSAVAAATGRARDARNSDSNNSSSNSNSNSGCLLVGW